MYIADVVFWGQDKGGRFMPPASGFKPQILIDDVKTSCVVTPVDESISIFDFNKLHQVKLELMFPNEYGGYLTLNSKVSLFEGNKQIAEGKVIECI